MVRGLITARHILLHPVTLISTWGVRGYLKMLRGCIDGGVHSFADFLSF